MQGLSKLQKTATSILRLSMLEFPQCARIYELPWIPAANFLLVFIHPIQRLPKSVLDTKFSQNATPGKKNKYQFVFAKKNIMRVKKISSPNPSLGYLDSDMSFPLLLCEAWFQILAGESHVADLAAAPGCRDPQGGRVDE